jgi:hypothetical protein
MMRVDDMGRRAYCLGNCRREYCGGADGRSAGQEGAPRMAGACGSGADVPTAIAKPKPNVMPFS